MLLLENIATSIKIGPEQLPSVYRLLIEAVRLAQLAHIFQHCAKVGIPTLDIAAPSAQAEILQMEPPELYVRQVRCWKVFWA